MIWPLMRRDGSRRSGRGTKPRHGEPAPRLMLTPLGDSADRPEWSVMIPTYHCAAYLRETLTSVLAQDPGVEHMQIEVVDDGSVDDDPEAVVRELGQGRVGFYRQPRNVGHVRNFETCLERARGRLVHLLHGDDVVRDGFYRRMEQAFGDHPEVGAAFCRHFLMDERGHWTTISWLEQPDDGILERWLERIAVEQRIQTPSIVVRREVYEQLGGFDRRLTACGEDWEMWVRIAASYPVWYLTDPLAAYRVTPRSLTGRSSVTAEDTRDLCLAIRIIASTTSHHLAPTAAKRLAGQARTLVALSALRIARRLLHAGNGRGAAAQVCAALACSQSVGVLGSAAPVVVRLALYALAEPTRRRAWSETTRQPSTSAGASSPEGAPV